MKSQDECADGADGRRPPTAFRPADAGMLVLHQLAVPAQDGVWADDKPESTQDGTGQGGQERRQEEAEGFARP
ncbi:hypothetical protein [[Actinomadura] parvosata]|uniref:hypothetical protein n=1 Tax=[Actinomadura] parvosata TaxID=1955412 RepID=UPI0012BCC083|nr:hypothetical protein [Nonomuraea sp. ATCC 55076]